MFARCPSCQTVFDVDDQTLSVRTGMVRCGVCRVTFNASWNLVDRLPEVELPETAVPSRPRQTEPAADPGPPPISDLTQRSPPPETPPSIAETPAVPAIDDTGEGAIANSEAEMAHEEYELDSESILDEVERLDAALQQKHEHKRDRADAAAESEDTWQAQAPFDVEPDHEIVLETPAESSPAFGTDTRSRLRETEHERIASSVDRMRDMLDPVQESPSPAQHAEDTTPPAPNSPPRPEAARTELPPEIDPYHAERKHPAAVDGASPDAQQIFEGIYESRDAEDVERATTIAALRTMAWFVALVIFLVAAIWQVRTFYLYDLAQNASLRPLVAGFCRIAMCELPQRRDSRRIDLVGTNVETHHAVPGALRVTVSLINRAGFSQAPPTLEVTLTDKLGRVVGRRTYSPDDYSPAEKDAILDPDVVENVMLDLAAPSESAVGYEIQLIPD